MKGLTEIFRKPSLIVVAQQELEEAKRSLLEAQSGYEFARRMADYHQDRIDRLSTYIKSLSVEQAAQIEPPDPPIQGSSFRHASG